jgi:hypothetical protein
MSRTRRIGYNQQLGDAAAVSNSTAVVMTATDLSALDNFAVYVTNTGATALNVFTLQTSPDTSSATNWVDVDTNTLKTLGAGAAGRIAVADNPGATYRAHASVASGTTALDIWVTGG